MITYFSEKFNNFIPQFFEILHKNNIDTHDAEFKVPDNINILLVQVISNSLKSVEDFVSTFCPKCKHSTLTPMTTMYQRNITFKVENLLLNFQITIHRLKCTNCASTHAVLPSFCVPFKKYSSQAILEIAEQASSTSTETIANNLNIDSKQVRRIVNIVKADKNNIMSVYYHNKSHFKIELTSNTELHSLIQSIPYNIGALYFKEFRSVFLLGIISKKLYIAYFRLSFWINNNTC